MSIRHRPRWPDSQWMERWFARAFVRLRPSLAALAALTLMGHGAAAGTLVYVMPEVGAEITELGSVLLEDDGSLAWDVRGAAGPSIGLASGVRLGPFLVGGRYQRTIYRRASFGQLNYNKLYAEVGLRARAGIAEGGIYFDLGWAFIDADRFFISGAGGKVGGSLDLFLTPWFSLGPGASLDLHAYRPLPMTVVGAYGGTFYLRIGFYPY